MMEVTERVLQYGDAYFVPRCKICNQYVKADEEIKFNDITGLSPEPNATCKKCGRTHMIFLGFV